MLKCSVCQRPAEFRASTLVRWAGVEEPVIHDARPVCAIHRQTYAPAPAALRARVETDLRQAKLPMPDWSRTQVAFEPL